MGRKEKIRIKTGEKSPKWTRSQGSKMSIQSIKLMSVNDIVPFISPPVSTGFPQKQEARPQSRKRLTNPWMTYKNIDTQTQTFENEIKKKLEALVCAQGVQVTEKLAHTHTQPKLLQQLDQCVSIQVSSADVYRESDENSQADSWHKVGTAGVIPSDYSLAD